jgi:hypothetical protein
MNSRSELLATENWLTQSMEKVPQIPAIYTNGRRNSTNSLLLQAAGKLEPYEALGDVSIEHRAPPPSVPDQQHPELRIGGFHEVSLTTFQRVAPLTFYTRLCSLESL